MVRKGGGMSDESNPGNASFAPSRYVEIDRDKLANLRNDALEEAAKLAEAAGRTPDCPYGRDKPGDPTWNHTEEDKCPVCGFKAVDSWRGCTVYANNRIAKDIRALKVTP